VTPTLIGRWQTRILLLLVVGVPVSLPFVLVAGPVPFLVLGYVLAIGLALDVVYDRKQRARWDHDWPVHLQVKAAFVEFFALIVVGLGCCGFAAFLAPPLLALGPVAVVVVPVHWWSMWGISFLVLQGPIRVLLPRWRFRGGRVL
jgi:hypothetical protein